MELLALPGGGASLEFRSFEAPLVLRALTRMGGHALQDRGGHQEMAVGGAALAYLPGWRAPCLIATERGGADILRRIIALAHADD